MNVEICFKRKSVKFLNPITEQADKEKKKNILLGYTVSCFQEKIIAHSTSHTSGGVNYHLFVNLLLLTFC